MSDTYPMTDQGTYHHGNLKEALVQAGLDILHQQGLSALTLRACAVRAGVSHTAPKNHFGNLAGLMSAIAARGYQKLTETMQTGLPQDATRADRRQAALGGYVDFAAQNPGLFELMFSTQRTNGDSPELMEQANRCFDVLRDVSEGLVWDKSDAPDAALRAQIMHWSMVHGFAQLTASGKLTKGAMKHLQIFDVFPQFDYKA
ncbi:TetR/AcrR family transcriptional regulator [uncultured Pseudosulfitobacter sp.]|uniref:TetR/AcrR family transcriptional regulator n=1 Tax=uncultured Pseudosulfitobacter sp. TaxID=2854214 RepID=UPI0030DDA79F